MVVHFQDIELPNGIFDRLPLHDEKECQRAFEDRLIQFKVEHTREYRLGDGSIIDFIIGNTGVEIKLKGQRHKIYRQVERYCTFSKIEQIILLSSVAIRLPNLINEKPTKVISLGRGWI